MKYLKRLAIGFAVLVGVLALIVVTAEAMLHNSGSKKLAEVTGVTDAAEPGWRIGDIMAARQASQPPAKANTAPFVLSLHAANDNEAWKHIAQSDDAVGYGGFAINTTPEFARVIWLMHAHHVANGVNDAAVERLLSKEFIEQPGGFYVLTIAENPYATLLPHVQKAPRWRTGLVWMHAMRHWRGIRIAASGPLTNSSPVVPSATSRSLSRNWCESPAQQRGSIRVSGARLGEAEGRPGRTASGTADRGGLPVAAHRSPRRTCDRR